MSVLVLFPLTHKLRTSSGQKYERGHQAGPAKSQVRSMGSVVRNSEDLANTSWGKWAFKSDPGAQIRRKGGKKLQAAIMMGTGVRFLGKKSRFGPDCDFSAGF